MQRISINDISPHGQTFLIDDPDVWLGPIAEFHMDCRILEPVSAEVLVLPTEKGCLVRGTLTGKVALPCNRCAESAEVTLNDRFETFEYLPGAPLDEDEVDEAPEEDSHITLTEGSPMLDLAALCWEEFSLALPVNPLCKPDCKGLCPVCGANLNKGRCACVHDEGDPRMAAPRNLTITKSGK